MPWSLVSRSMLYWGGQGEWRGSHRSQIMQGCRSYCKDFVFYSKWDGEPVEGFMKRYDRIIGGYKYISLESQNTNFMKKIYFNLWNYGQIRYKYSQCIYDSNQHYHCTHLCCTNIGYWILHTHTHTHMYL